MDNYPEENECPKCEATNAGGEKNVESLGSDEYFCHKCKHMWEDPLGG